MFRNQACTYSAPSRGTIPQGKGREGIRKGKEGPNCVSHASTDLLGRAFAAACRFAESRWGR